MQTHHRLQRPLLGLAALLGLVLCTPVSAQEEGSSVAMAPTASSWDETSGCVAVETNRASIGYETVGGQAIEPTGHEVAKAIGYSAAALAILGITKVLSVMLLEPVGAQEEEEAIAKVPAAASWNETSGYGVG